MHALEITHFTDPACPFAFSAEPTRLRLRWQAQLDGAVVASPLFAPRLVWLAA